MPAEKDLLGQILTASTRELDKIHIATGWVDLLRIALWTGDPAAPAILDLLRKSGAKEEEVAPYKGCDPGDIFFWLYYGRRFDILRRICRAAKTAAESRVRRPKPLLSCHLVSEEGAIVASSL